MEPFPFWAQVWPGVGLQLIAAQPGQGLGKRFSIVLFLMGYLSLRCLREQEECRELNPT